jgi:hypothetical protein
MCLQILLDLPNIHFHEHVELLHADRRTVRQINGRDVANRRIFATFPCECAKTWLIL